MSEDSPRIFVPPPLIFAGLLFLGLALDRERVTFGALQMIAVIMGSAGLGLIATALGLFRRNRTRPEPWQPSSALVSDGIYRFTRNPMYLGMAIICFAVSLFLLSLAAGILTLLAIAVIDRAVIAREEAYLLRQFGDTYRDYQAKVRRWL